jgi:hypothetical protein
LSAFPRITLEIQLRDGDNLPAAGPRNNFRHFSASLSGATWNAMHTRYYQTLLGVFQTDRRQRHIVYSGHDRRHADRPTVTSREVEFLRSGLQDLKNTVGSMYRLTRRIRHTVAAVSLTILFIGTATADLSPQLLIASLAMSVLAVASSYLIVYSTRTTIYRCRLNHRRRFIENVLERFGFPTAFGIAQQHRAWCHEPARVKRNRGASVGTLIALNAYDVMLALIVITAYIVSVQSAFMLSSDPSLKLWPLRMLNVLAPAVAIVSVVVFALVRKHDEALAAEFMKEHAAWLDNSIDGDSISLH